MMSITIKVDDITLKKMEKFYSDDMSINHNQYALFIVKLENCTITAYKTNKILFQGTKAEEEAAIWTTIKINEEKKQQQQYNNNDYYSPSIGSDEVGTGDYFGPVVVVACYLEPEKLEIIKKLKIDDSKKLTDADIIKIAPTLFKEIPYSLLVVHNSKYNEVMKKDMNLNKLKALLHKQAISKLLSKINYFPSIIIDQFCSIDNFNHYTKDTQFSKQINFQTKAESKFASVACASMMARYIFLEEMDKLSTELKTTLLKGASSKVDLQARELVNQFGENILNKIAKLHFKNTEKIKSLN